MKEDFPMKTAICKTNYRPTTRIPYPNAASRKQIVNRIVDLTLTFVLGAGAAAIVLFVLAVA